MAVANVEDDRRDVDETMVLRDAALAVVNAITGGGDEESKERVATARGNFMVCCSKRLFLQEFMSLEIIVHEREDRSEQINTLWEIYIKIFIFTAR